MHGRLSAAANGALGQQERVDNLLEAWSLKRFFEIDLQVWSSALAARFDQRFSVPAEAVSAPGRRLTGTRERAKAALFAGLSPLL